jgi:hypothetical protein
MLKYLLFVVIGIILYLLWNSVDGFSISGLNVGDDCSIDDCGKDQGNCYHNLGHDENFQLLSINLCECRNINGSSICQLKDPNEEDKEVIETIKFIKSEKEKLIFDDDSCAPSQPSMSKTLTVNMPTNKTDGSKPDYCKEEVVKLKEISTSCNELCDTPPCEFLIPSHECSFNFSYKENSDPNSYSEYGYGKLDNFLDVDGPNTTFQEYVDELNRQNGYKIHNIIHPRLNLRFTTYMLKTYIERSNRGSAKHIADGIFYCNGKIFYYVNFLGTTRLIMNALREDYITSKYMVNKLNKYHHIQIQEGRTQAYPAIHTDFPNIGGIPQRFFPEEIAGYGGQSPVSGKERYNTLNTPDTLLQTLTDGTYNGCSIETSFSQLEGIIIPDPSIEGITVVTFKNSFNHEYLLGREMNLAITNIFDNKHKMFFHFLRNNKQNYDLFNIWLQLIGTYDDKTLGFFRSPQTNPGLDNLYVIDDDPNKLSGIYEKLGGESSTDASVNHLENKTAYTFQMNDGDALRFTEDKTPHFGRTSIKGVRYSVESRYILLPFEFDINDVFEIPRVSILSVKTGQFDNTPNVIPPYLPLTIYKWFQDEFDFILPIYDRLKAQETIDPTILAHSRIRGNISVEIFQMVLDNVPLHRYMDDTKKVAAITAYLVNGI